MKNWWNKLSVKKKVLIVLIPILIALGAWYSTTDTYKRDKARMEAEAAERAQADREARKDAAAAFGRALGGALMDKASEKGADAVRSGVDSLRKSVDGVH